MDAIKNRRSIRKFKNKEISTYIIEEIIKAAALAPSAKNRQPWKYIVYSGDPKSQLLDAMKKGLLRERDGEKILPESSSGISDAFHTLEIMNSAPVIVIILNTNGTSPFKPLSDDRRITEICDTLSIGASIQNMLLTATEMGIGSLWIANTCFAYNELKEYISTDHQIVGAVALGYPDESPFPRPRKDITNILEFRTNQENPMIAACGNDCNQCPRHLPKSQSELSSAAKLWMKIGYRDHIVPNDEIACKGCAPSNWCRYKIISCTSQRNINNCGECPEYPCNNLTECFEVTGSFIPQCKKVCSQTEFLKLEKAFFRKKENLEAVAAERSKLKTNIDKNSGK